MTRKRKITTAGIFGAVLCVSVALGAENYLVEQKDKNFYYKGTKIETLKIKLGDSIEFRNMDPYFHNVFRCRT